MKESEYNNFMLIINYFGGTIRWILVSIFTFILKIEKPKRADYIIPLDIKSDYEKHTNTEFKNVITFIIALFVLFSFLLILKNKLF